jgi:hypothetical protein
MPTIETIPALSNAMDKRIRILNSSVELMEKLQARISAANIDLMRIPDAVELLKVMSHQFTEVLEACRRCSTDDLVDRLENLHLYQLIQGMTKEEKVRLREALSKSPMANAVDVTVIEVEGQDSGSTSSPS